MTCAGFDALAAPEIRHGRADLIRTVGAANGMYVDVIRMV